MILFQMNEAFAEACFWEAVWLVGSFKEYKLWGQDFIAMYCGM